jgi:hypothetical protein
MQTNNVLMVNYAIMVNNAIMAPSLHVRRCSCQRACLTVLLWYLVHALLFHWRTCLKVLLSYVVLACLIGSLGYLVVCVELVLLFTVVLRA